MIYLIQRTRLGKSRIAAALFASRTGSTKLLNFSVSHRSDHKAALFEGSGCPIKGLAADRVEDDVHIMRYVLETLLL
ncbi:hypothetical protein QE435_004991 [Rhizobium sp. SORGH_AS 787]|nr:hypothetical protein [Rhizobium sp. SORGH_AS_0787]